MNKSNQHSGGCACGTIRYTISNSPAMIAYCHCQECRRTCGSVVSVLAGFARSGFELNSSEPAVFQSSAAVKRSFCKDCGTSLFYENQHFPENIYIHIGSFDQPENFPPDRHTFTSDRVCWYQINDDLIQYDQLSNAGLADNTPPYANPMIEN